MNDIDTKMYVKLSVRESKISGKGLFSEEDISIGQTILTFGGNLHSQEDRYTGNVLRSTCIGISENILLCEEHSSEKDFSDYINHSCDPNAGMMDSITLVSIKPIKIGEEIFCDYAFWESEENWVMKSDCYCGTEKCRKTINGKYWKEILPSNEYFKYYSPFLKRRIIENEKKNQRIGNRSF